MIYEDTKNPNWSFYVDITEDMKYMGISVTESTTGNALYIRDIKTQKQTVLVDNFESSYYIVDHINGKLLIMTNNNAPKYKIVAVDPHNPERENWVDFIPEAEGVLNGISLVGGKIIASYMEDAHSKIRIFDLSGKYLYDIDNQEVGSIGGFSGKIEDNETFYTVTSFTTPATIYRYDVASNKSELYESSAVDFDASKYETKQIFIQAKMEQSPDVYCTQERS